MRVQWIAGGESPRVRERVNQGWKFALGDIPGAQRDDFDDQTWRKIDLPHDWSVGREFREDYYLPGVYVGDHLERRGDACLPKGIGWYRKHLAIDRSMAGRRIELEFEGVFRDSALWINGQYVGVHREGYTGFRYDITGFVHCDGQPNLVAMRVDATDMEGWWYEGAGIYRHVWLTAANEFHIVDWDTFVRTPAVSEKFASVNLTVGLQCNGSRPERSRLAMKILGREGKTIAESTDDIHATDVVTQHFAIDNPRLWSPENPHLYRARAELQADGRVVDEYEMFFGLRRFEFTADQGFFLNGRQLQLRGMCLHHDCGGLGTALPDRVNVKTVEIMKEAGCNLLRSAHNAAAPALMDACDRLGMLFIAETRYYLGVPERIVPPLRELIRRDRNHPCIIAWSLANTAGTPDGSLTRNLKVLNDTAHREDPDRPTMVCLEGNADANANGFALVTDVVGYNGGGMGIDDRDHTLYPGRRIFISEFSSGRGARGVYEDPPPQAEGADEVLGDGRVMRRSGQYVSGCDLCLAHEREWSHIARRPWLAGGAMWSGIEYRGETTGWPMVTSQFGIFDLCRFRKDAFYYYAQEWTKEPMVHIFPHWNWTEGREIDVWCYANCDLVELLLNGRSLGTKAVQPLTHLEWKVRYTPGRLTARGFKDGNPVCEHEIRTAGEPAKIRLTADRPELLADGNDVSFITAEILDADDNPAPAANNELSFRVRGNGRLLGICSGDPSSHEDEQGQAMKAFNGLCLALVQSDCDPGRIILTVSSPGLASGEVVCISRQK